MNPLRKLKRALLRSLLILASVAFFAAVPSAFSQTIFTPGDLVVSTYGVGGGYLNGTWQSTSVDGVPTTISLEEFTPSGALVATHTLPVTDSGSNFGIVGEYGSSSEGNLQLSGDGQSLLIAGYQADASIAGTGSPGGLGYYNGNPDGVDALAQSNASDVPRLVAVVGANGVANVSTQFNNIYNQNNPRSVWSANGATLYVSGQGNGTADQGVFTVQAGSNTVTGSPAPTPISSNTGLSTRIVSAYNGNLYYSTDVKSVATGIFQYSGIPTSAATATAILPANGTTGNLTSGTVNYSPDGFYFANSTTLYVADTGSPKNKATGDGGIQKWTFSGGAWHLDYTLTPANFIHAYNDKTSVLTDGEVGFESITGMVVNGTVDLYAVSYTIGDADQDGLYAVTDSLSALINPGDSFTELATAPGVGDNSTFTTTGGSVFKSVAFAPITVPEPGTYALIFGAVGGALAMFYRRRQTTIAK